MNENEFLIHCDTWVIEKRFKGIGQPEITLNGQTLHAAQTPIMTEPMEQYQMAGTEGYVLVVPINSGAVVRK